MQFVVLKIVDGPEAGKKMTVRGGQMVYVGRSPRADLSVAGDPQLADAHFILDCTRGSCEFRLSPGSPPVFVGDEELSSGTLYDGDRFQAGTSTFEVRIEGQTRPKPAALSDESGESASPKPQESGYAKVAATTVDEILEGIDDPPEEIVAAHEEAQTPRELVDKLVECGHSLAALQFLTHALPKREAVWALATAIETMSGGELPENDATALQAAKTWTADPSEENRRAAEVPARKGKMKTPSACAAQAAFWSEGSMAGPDDDEVPAMEPMCHNVVFSGAVQLAGAEDDFDAAVTRLLAHWTAVADGESTWT